MDHTVSVVVFTVPEKRLREMDVATGPCVPTAGRKRPLVGASRQDGGEYPEQTSALYTALTGRPADEALSLLAREKQGRLYAATPAFHDAMADASERLDALRAADLGRGDEKQSSWWTEWQALGEACSRQRSGPAQSQPWNIGWAGCSGHKQRGSADSTSTSGTDPRCRCTTP